MDISIFRIVSALEIKTIKQIAEKLKLKWLQFTEINIFAQFTSDKYTLSFTFKNDRLSHSTYLTTKSLFFFFFKIV